MHISKRSDGKYRCHIFVLRYNRLADATQVIVHQSDKKRRTIYRLRVSIQNLIINGVNEIFKLLIPGPGFKHFLNFCFSSSSLNNFLPYRYEAQNWEEGVDKQKKDVNLTVRVPSHLGIFFSIINGTFDGSNREGNCLKLFFESNTNQQLAV